MASSKIATELRENSIILYSDISNIVNGYMTTSLEGTFFVRDDNYNYEDTIDLTKYKYLGN
jgi:hypothetical protein